MVIPQSHQKRGVGGGLDSHGGKNGINFWNAASD